MKYVAITCETQYLQALLDKYALEGHSLKHVFSIESRAEQSIGGVVTRQVRLLVVFEKPTLADEPMVMPNDAPSIDVH